MGAHRLLPDPARPDPTRIGRDAEDRVACFVTDFLIVPTSYVPAA
ncbi:hypothetical protein [Streptomyces yangpuensis]